MWVARESLFSGKLPVLRDLSQKSRTREHADASASVLTEQAFSPMDFNEHYRIAVEDSRHKEEAAGRCRVTF